MVTGTNCPGGEDDCSLADRKRAPSGQPVGDPSERDLFVYLPHGYEGSHVRYPTAYLLHDFGKDAEELVQPPTDGRRWTPPIEDVLDPVFARMGVAPMIVVIPDGWTRLGCSQWVDSPVGGNFEQYLLHDVVAHVDDNYRTLPDPASRGVLGFSSGVAGHGTLLLETRTSSGPWRCFRATRSWT